MLKAIDNQDLILYTVVPFTSVLILIFLAYLIRKFCCLKRSNADQESLLGNETTTQNSNNQMSLSNMRVSNDIFFIQKVNEQKRKLIKESRDSAYVYFQFYIRSNPTKIFKSIEHLNNIGNQPETERNWFLVKQTLKIDNNDTNKYRIVFINVFNSKVNTKVTKLVEIADSIGMDLKEMEILLDKFFQTLKHPHVLSFDTINVNFDKERILFIQDFSRDGSLRDYLRNTDPYDIWDIKLEKQTKKFLPLKTIKEFGKQILSGLIFLKQNILLPVDNLHSGNIILAYKKKICLLTGYENIFFFNKTRADITNEKFKQKISKTYLIEVKDEETDEILIRKAKTELELKRIIETLRFGLLIIEMCTGLEQEELIPDQTVINSLKSTYSLFEFNDLSNLLNFIFFNRDFKDSNNDKYKKKYLIPSTEQIYSHYFFETVNLKEKDSQSLNTKSPQQIELLQYLTGKLEMRKKKLRRKSSLAINNFSKRKVLSTIKEPEIEASTEIKETPIQISTTSTSVAFLPQQPPPPPPPPPVLSQMNQTNPPPAPPPPLSLSSDNTDDRSALLGDIRKGLKLKKTVTIDKSKPKLI